MASYLLKVVISVDDVVYIRLSKVYLQCERGPTRSVEIQQNRARKRNGTWVGSTQCQSTCFKDDEITNLCDQV